MIRKGREWQMELVIKRFDELTVRELHEIYMLRVSVFVVEQTCPYQEIDAYDPGAIHMYLKDADGIQAYLRVLDRNTVFDTVSLGRVISAKRGCGLGAQIVTEGIKVAQDYLNAKEITIAAQTYAKGFYEKAGFVQSSEEFLEDDIPHMEMKLIL